jgi:sulfite exporter TauE/SafE
MLGGLLVTALLMGLAGAPHCVAMCGAASGGIGATPRRQLAFQAGRVLGYAALGVVAASSFGLLQWGAEHSALLRPFWAMFHVAVFVVGASLAWHGRQPRWLERASHVVWQRLRSRTLDWDVGGGPVVAGALWALLPCGLLYSALMVAALAEHAWEGGLTMSVFGLATAASLQAGPMLWRWWRRGAAASGSPAWGVRVAGAALALASAWALADGLWHDWLRAMCA